MDGRNLSQSERSFRTLKIEADGHFAASIKPKIRLTGRWLEQAGFKPGNRVHVTCICPGVIELRSLGALNATSADQYPSEQAKIQF